MILAVSIKILGGFFGVGEEGQSSNSILAGVEKIDHGIALGVEGEAVVALHPSGEALVVARLKMNECSVCSLDYGIAP